VALKNNNPEAQAFKELAGELSRQISIGNEFRKNIDIVKNSGICNCSK